VTVHTMGATSQITPADQFTYVEAPTVTRSNPRAARPARGRAASLAQAPGPRGRWLLQHGSLDTHRTVLAAGVVILPPSPLLLAAARRPCGEGKRGSRSSPFNGRERRSSELPTQRESRARSRACRRCLSKGRAPGSRYARTPAPPLLTFRWVAAPQSEGDRRPRSRTRNCETPRHRRHLPGRGTGKLEL
jgi:hypothetical protein